MATLKLLELEANKDTRVLSGLPDNNYGLQDFIYVGNNSGDISRGLLQFDLSSIPENSIIVSATLSFITFINSNPGTLSPLYFHRSMVEWYEGDGNNSITTIDGSTWNNRNHIGTVAWSTPGGQVNKEYVPTYSVSISDLGIVGTQHLIDVTEDITQWYQGLTPNYGWWILGDEVTVDSGGAFRSSEHVDGPILSITYYVYNQCACVPTPLGSELFNNLLYWFDMEEPEGTNRIDSHRGIEAVEQLTPVERASGIKNSAASFDLSNVLYVPPNPDLEGWHSDSISWSFSTWFKPNTGVEFFTVIALYAGNHPFRSWIVFTYPDQHIEFAIYYAAASNYQLNAGSNVIQNEWNFIAGSYDHTTRTMYFWINDTPAETLVIGATDMLLNAVGLTFGGFGITNSFARFNGEIDSSGIWKNHVLSNEEVLWLRNNGRARKYSDLKTLR